MKELEHQWKSSAGSGLFAWSWQPAESAKAVITLVHGFGEHCLRYTPYVSYFINQGFAVVGFDLQGHGQSDGKRGVIKSYDSLLDDIGIALNKSSEMFPNLPQFLYAHSMGGNLGLNFMLRRESNIKATVLSGPWLTLYNDPGIFAKLGANIMKNMLPNLTANSNIELKYLCTDSHEVEKYEQDPLVHGKISSLLFHSISSSGIWAMENTGELIIPTLIMHGTEDKITSPKASKLAALNNEEYIEWLGWPGAFHEIHNEPNKSDVAEAAIAFFDKHLH